MSNQVHRKLFQIGDQSHFLDEREGLDVFINGYLCSLQLEAPFEGKRSGIQADILLFHQNHDLN